jgi:hypothetical protein
MSKSSPQVIGEPFPDWLPQPPQLSPIYETGSRNRFQNSRASVSTAASGISVTHGDVGFAHPYLQPTKPLAGFETGSGNRFHKSSAGGYHREDQLDRATRMRHLLSCGYRLPSTHLFLKQLP